MTSQQTVDHQIPGDSSAKHRIPYAIFRRPLREITIKRILAGGRLEDAGRLPRYVAITLLGATVIWAPIVGYLKTAPLRYSSQISLILPGSGANASVNLNNIGQASSSASSAFSNQSVSPTETYKRLIGADRILAAAAQTLGISKNDFGSPRIQLVDQTSLIHLEITGESPIDAQSKGDALLASFFTELDSLRADEQYMRADSGSNALDEYRNSVATTRAEISSLQDKTGLISVDQYRNFVADKDKMGAKARDLAGTYQNKLEAVRSLEATLGLSADLAAKTLKLYADSEYTAIVAQMSNDATRLAETRAEYGEQHPSVVQARAAYETSRSAAATQAALATGLDAATIAQLDLAPAGARAELLAELVRMNAELSGLKIEYATLNQQLLAETDRLYKLAADVAKLEDLQRDFSVAEAVFASAIARTQTTKADVYASYPLVQVLENPTLPKDPSSPRRKLAIAAGAAATMMLLMGLALGWVRRPLIRRILNLKPDSGA